MGQAGVCGCRGLSRGWRGGTYPVMQFQRLPKLAGGSRGPGVPMRLGGAQADSVCLSKSGGQILGTGDNTERMRAF